MYSIFANDLALYSEKATILQYADDTQILVTGQKKNLQHLIHDMETALTSVFDWFTAHSMKVNTTKTQLIVFVYLVF